MKTRRFVALLAAVPLLFLGACSSSDDKSSTDPEQTPQSEPAEEPADEPADEPVEEPPPADDGAKPVVGLVMKSLGNSYFQEMQKGADEFAASDDSFELRSVGIQSETDIDGQIEAVNNLIAQGVNAIVIAPADSQALVAPLKDAAAAGITLVNIDVKLDDQALADAGLDVPFVGPDNVEGARQVGGVLAAALGEGAKVVIIEGISGAANAQQRKAGFDLAVEEGGMDLLASTSANWETDEANTVFSNLLVANPDIQGVMCANDSMALGVIAALEAQNNTDIKVVGFDNVPEVQPMLSDGRLLATLDQFGSQQAQFGIEAALKLLNGQTVDTWEKTPIQLIEGTAS
jgi:ribose transport system substrate-binding protein